MTVQFVVVRFPSQRGVLIDGEHGGQTDTTLRVGEGRHTIKLDGPQNYRPKWRRPLVTGTNPIQPMEVVFERSSD